MALSDILETIRAESRDTASGVLASAEAEADRLLGLAGEQAAKEERRLAASLDDKARLERSRIMSRAHLEAAQERRTSREKVYLAALEGVARHLGSVRSSPEYENVLASLLDEAIAVLPDATTVRVDPTDVAITERALTARGLELLIEPEESALGGVVVTAEGRAVDNSLQTRLDRADEHFRYIAGELIPDLRGGVG
ncbi:MAG: V-type ATP synthase subunit E [Actinomycetota bacterium]|nr:V-type ATP synthase subunit E [Actinomycetota bacterium]